MAGGNVTYGAGGTSTNGGTFTGLGPVYTPIATVPIGNNVFANASPWYTANVRGTVTSLVANGNKSNCGTPYYSSSRAYIPKAAAGTMYFSRYTGNGLTVYDAGDGTYWGNLGSGGLQGNYTWSCVPGTGPTPSISESGTVAGQVTVSWGAVADTGNSAITNYQVRDATTPTTIYASLGNVLSTTINLTPKTSYNLVVTAQNARGIGVMSASTNVVTNGVPDTPSMSGTTQSTTVSGRLTANWTAPGNGGAAIDYYHLYYNGGAFIAQVAGTSYNVDGLTPGTNYSFAVYAHNVYGWSAVSSGSTSVTALGWTSGAPTLSTPTPSTTTAGSVGLSWTATTVNSGSVTYSIYVDGTLYSSGLTGTSTTVTGLVPGTGHTFRVDAVSTFGSLSSSTSGTITAPGAPFVWNGTEWARASAPQVYNGTDWVNATTIGIADGSAGWKTTN